MCSNAVGFGFVGVLQWLNLTGENMNNENELIAALATIEKLRSERDQLAAENVALKSFGDTLFDMYKGLEISGGVIHDEQSVVCQQAALDAAMSAFEEIETHATDRIVAGIKAEAKSHDLNAFISHYSAELDNHIANGGDQFDERAERLRSVIVGARMFREKLRDEEKALALREGAEK